MLPHKIMPISVQKRYALRSSYEARIARFVKEFLSLCERGEIPPGRLETVTRLNGSEEVRFPALRIGVVPGTEATSPMYCSRAGNFFRLNDNGGVELVIDRDLGDHDLQQLAQQVEHAVINLRSSV